MTESIPAVPVTTLFLDIGGVLLTNGWGRQVRRVAAEKFRLDFAEMDERHHLSFTAYETGKLTLDQYLDQVVFYQPRPFPRDEFKAFMYAQSQPFPDMLNYLRALKERCHLKMVVVSNEGRELTAYRVQTFHLKDFIDAFVVSSYVHYRKSDQDIYALALDIAQVMPDQVVYIDDRAMFVEVAGTLGIRGIHHIGYDTTRAELQTLGLT